MTSPQLLRRSTPTARKTHYCSLCTGPVMSGQTYTRETVVYDGHIYDWLTCTPCLDDEIYQIALGWSSRFGEGIEPEIVYEWAEETVRHGSPDDQRAAKNYLERVSSTGGLNDE